MNEGLKWLPKDQIPMSNVDTEWSAGGPNRGVVAVFSEDGLPGIAFQSTETVVDNNLSRAERLEAAEPSMVQFAGQVVDRQLVKVA